MNKKGLFYIFLFLVILILAHLTGCEQQEKDSDFFRSDRSIEFTSDMKTTDFSDEFVMYLFYAEWCPYCKELDKRMPDILDEYEDLKVVNIDIDEHRSLAGTFNALSTPTVVLDHPDRERIGFVGALPTETIISIIEEW